MKINSMPSLKNYLSFVAAKEFYYENNFEQRFPNSTSESIANVVLMPIQVPIDYIFNNFDQPLFIAALNVLAVGGITLACYPDICFQALEITCSPFFKMERWMPKLAYFVFTESMITSLMMRTLSRCMNQELKAAWEEKKIMPLHLGMLR